MTVVGSLTSTFSGCLYSPRGAHTAVSASLPRLLALEVRDLPDFLQPCSLSLRRADLLPEAWIAPQATRDLRALLRHRARRRSTASGDLGPDGG